MCFSMAIIDEFQEIDKMLSSYNVTRNRSPFWAARVDSLAMLFQKPTPTAVNFANGSCSVVLYQAANKKMLRRYKHRQNVVFRDCRQMLEIFASVSRQGSRSAIKFSRLWLFWLFL